MSPKHEFEIPDFDGLFNNLLANVKAEHRPLVMAMLERVAAALYREWASLSDHRSKHSELLACADREEEIASRVEALYPNAGAIQKELAEAMPELARVADDLFGGRTVPHQMAILAAGERAGGELWQRLAQAETAERARAAMLACAPLEEANAVVLEAILAGR